MSNFVFYLFVMTFKYRMYLKCLDKFQDLVLPTNMRKKICINICLQTLSVQGTDPCLPYLSPSEFCLLGQLKTLVH